jgi:hypothetical protein
MMLQQRKVPQEMLHKHSKLPKEEGDCTVEDNRQSFRGFDSDFQSSVSYLSKKKKRLGESVYFTNNIAAQHTKNVAFATTK